MTDNFNSDDWYDASFAPEEATERKLARLHPTAEEMLLKFGIEKVLNKRQRDTWEMFAYDRMTYEEIGNKQRPKVSKQAVEQRVKTIERKLEKYCLEHKRIYDTIKEAL